MKKGKIRVLVVDDMRLAREFIAEGLNTDPHIEVVGTASDPYDARDKIIELEPDVMTLDVEMPRMNGVEFLGHLMPQHPIPVIMLSAQGERGQRIALQALEAGAVDFVTKPSSTGGLQLSAMIQELKTKIKIAATAHVSHWKHASASRTPSSNKPYKSTAKHPPSRHLIAVGASTGGPDALRQLLVELPIDCPGVVIAQHMPAQFTALLAERLNDQVSIECREAQHGEKIHQGCALIAPGGKHTEVREKDGYFYVYLSDAPPVHNQRPSVDTLFYSVAKYARSNAVGVILTGMGKDGAAGLLAMRKAGSDTYGEDASTCVVYGMPCVAYEMGAVVHQLPLPQLAKSLAHHHWIALSNRA